MKLKPFEWPSRALGGSGLRVYKAIHERYDEAIYFVTVSDIGRISNLTHLLRYETTYGRFRREVEVCEDRFVADGEEAENLKMLPPGCRLGFNTNRFVGGFRLQQRLSKSLRQDLLVPVNRTSHGCSGSDWS